MPWSWWCTSKREMINELKNKNFDLQHELASVYNEVERRTEAMLKKKRYDEDGDGQTPKRQKRNTVSDEDTVGNTSTCFQKLDSNLTACEGSLKDLGEKNYNLATSLKQKDKEIRDLKQRLNESNEKLLQANNEIQKNDEEFTSIRRSCVRILEQLPNHSGNVFLAESNLQACCNLVYDEVKKLVEKMKDDKLLQKSSKDEAYVERITRLEEARIELENENQKLSKSYGDRLLELEVQNQKLQAKISKEQTPLCDNIRALYSLLQGYEESTKMDDIAGANGRLSVLNKNSGQLYGEQIRALNLEIFKMVEASNAPELRRIHETFKQRIKSKTERIRRLEGVSTVHPKELKRKFENSVKKIVSDIQDEVELYRQILSDFAFTESHRKSMYEDLVSALTQELGRLQATKLAEGKSEVRDLRRSSDLFVAKEEEKDPYVMDSLKHIIDINKRSKELEDRVDKFRGSKTDPIFLDLDHKLLGNVMEVDTIQVNGFEVVREKRREAIKYAYDCMAKLKHNLIDDSN